MHKWKVIEQFVELVSDAITEKCGKTEWALSITTAALPGGAANDIDDGDDEGDLAFKLHFVGMTPTRIEPLGLHYSLRVTRTVATKLSRTGGDLTISKLLQGALAFAAMGVCGDPTSRAPTGDGERALVGGRGLGRCYTRWSSPSRTSLTTPTGSSGTRGRKESSAFRRSTERLGGPGTSLSQ